MREPGFWHRRKSLQALALAPFGAIYGEIAATRMARPGLACGAPVVCVGNYHAGGAGKTPTVLAICAMLRARGETSVILSRGYGGRLRGPVVVDGARHTAADVGDEPLMLSADETVVVSRDRVDGAALARARGASVIVMDDGFQNPALEKSLSLIVIDAARGIGNGRCIPAGPLRAPLAMQIARTDALIVIGTGGAAESVVADVAAQGKAVFAASIEPDAVSVDKLRGHPLLAFCGIGDPDRFARTLAAAGLDVRAFRAFGDHHAYTKQELSTLQNEAQRRGARLVTTRKDAARLGDAVLRDLDIATLRAELRFADGVALGALLDDRLIEARLPRR